MNTDSADLDEIQSTWSAQRQIVAWLLMLIAPYLAQMGGFLVAQQVRDGSLATILVPYAVLVLVLLGFAAWVTRPSAGRFPNRLLFLAVFLLDGLLTPVLSFIYALRHANWS